MALHKICDVVRQGLSIDIAAHLQFGGDIGREIGNPVLERVEGHDADRIVELRRQQFANDHLEIAAFELDVATVTAASDDAIDDDIDGLIGPVGHKDR